MSLNISASTPFGARDAAVRRTAPLVEPLRLLPETSRSLIMRGIGADTVNRALGARLAARRGRIRHIACPPGEGLPRLAIDTNTVCRFSDRPPVRAAAA